MEVDGKYIVGLRHSKLRNTSISAFSSVISAFIGLFVGFLLMLFAMIFTNGANAFAGLGIMFAGPFNGTYVALEFGNMIFYSVPIIFTGLSITLAYKTGLFNIGAPGQFFMGTLGCLLVALNINTVGNRFLGILVWILAIIVGLIFGMIWGSLAGLLKAFFGINEVIASIMLNWISANIVTWVFSLNSSIINSDAGKSGYLIKTAQTGNFSPSLGLDQLFSGGTSKSYIDIGIIFAILMCVIVWVLLNKTTIGYSMKACGSNREAAKYAGINDKKNIIFAMTFAGGLAALGGCFYFLNPNIEFAFNSAYQNLPAWGFNGIPVAFLANCHPLGVLVSALFVRYLNSSGTYLPVAGYNQYFADIIIAVIIYLSGFTRFFKERIDRFVLRREEKRAQASKEIEGVVAEVTSKKKPNPFVQFFINAKDYVVHLFNKIFKREKKTSENEEVVEKKEETEGGDK